MSKEKPSLFKTGLNFTQAQNKRVEQTITLRKKKRKDTLRRKRMDNKTSPFSLGVSLDSEYDLDMCIEWMKSEETRLKGCMGVRMLLSDHDGPIQEVIDKGLVEYFIGSLRSDHLGVVFEACWCLTNIVSGTEEQTYTVVARGAVDYLVELIMHQYDQIAEQAVWTLGNIAGGNPLFRDYVLSRGTMNTLVQVLLKTECKSLLGTSSWVLSNLCRGRPVPSWDNIGNIMYIIPKLLDSNDKKIIADTCWALSFITDENVERLQDLINSGLCLKVIPHLNSCLDVQVPALRILGNIINGTTEQADYLLDLNVTENLKHLLRASESIIRKEVCWVISNIAAGPNDQKQKVIDSDIYPELLRLIENDEYDIKRECIWTFANACSGNEEQKEYLLSIDVIEYLAPFLDKPDPDIVRLILEAFMKLLEYNQYFQFDDVRDRIESSGALRSIEELFNENQNTDIEKYCEVIKNHFSSKVQFSMKLPIDEYIF